MSSSQASSDHPCTHSVIARSVNLFALAVTVTLVFIFFSLPPVEDWFERYIPNFEYRLGSKALLFLVFVYIIDRIIMSLRRDIDADVCAF